MTDPRQSFLLTKGDRPARERSIARICSFLLALGDDCAWRVEVAKVRRSRSDQQNRALWGVAYKTLCDATGNEAEDLHQFFLGEHFGWDTIDVLGQKRRVPKRRSSKLSTVEFSDFYGFIQRRAAECGYYVPDPDEPK